MAEREFFQTIDKSVMAEFRDRGSRFIGYAFPVESTIVFKKELEQVKSQHPKATHHCFAYRIGMDGEQFRSSDAGEPSGTAGKPILGQIDSRELTNTAIVVVRYFGGSLLGVPGLINAYKSAAALALQVAPIVRKQVERNIIINFDYTRMNEVMVIIRQFSGRVVRQEMQLFCQVEVAVPVSRAEELLYRLKDNNLEAEKKE